VDLAAVTIPGSVLEGTRYVAAAARDVTIRDDTLARIAGLIDARLAAGIDDVDVAFGSAGTLARDVNMIMFETACNFCFWGERPEGAWKVEVGDTVVGGWYGLAACFNSAARGGMPVWDAEWMSRLTVERAHRLFTGIGAPIPLIEQRVNNIVEAANFLLRKYHGQALDLLTTADFSAPEIVATMVRELPSFRDGSWYRGRWVWILKRAQIFPSDLGQLTARYPEFRIANRDQLTAFADYRLPQVLRHLGALDYSSSLSAVVDGRMILPAGSAPEMEIRACTIETCERLKRHLGGRTSADIDLGLWLMGQDMRKDPGLLPHHRAPGQWY
jgi:hypothetical protein